VACQDPPDDDCADPLPEEIDGPDEKPLDVEPLLVVELPLDEFDGRVELVESSSEDVLDDVPEVEEPVLPDCSVDELELLCFLLASVSALATAAKARDPTAVAVSKPPVTRPTRRKPWSRLFMNVLLGELAHRRGRADVSKVDALPMEML
jgi:hypothetical protein